MWLIGAMVCLLAATDVLLESVDVLLPFITAMCNASLREGVLPASQKAARREEIRLGRRRTTELQTHL